MPTRVSDTGMHRGTCVTHVPWWIPGSLTSSFLWSRWRGKRSRHSRRMRKPQFAYLVRGPWPTPDEVLSKRLSQNASTLTLPRCFHDDVMKWKQFPRYWPFVRGIHRSPVNSPYKGQWCAALMFSLICVWINCWVNNREAGSLRRHHAHYGVTVMSIWLRIITPMQSGTS